MDSCARRPYFIDEDDGLVSLVDLEAGFSGNQHGQYSQHFLLRPMICHGGDRRRGGLGNLPVSASRVSARFYDVRFDDRHQHFLDACFLCKKLLGVDKDIFMYRGDTPFCSEDCRQVQIDMDEAKEKKMNLSSSIKAAMRNKDQRKSTSSDKSTTANHNCRFRAGTVAAA